MLFSKTSAKPDRQQQFLELADRYKGLIAKVCSLYSSPSAPFADLYQEVMVNLWSGMDSYRGDAKASTWIYRLAINTCITWHRRNRRHTEGAVSLDFVAEPADDSESRLTQWEELNALIGRLDPFDKALIAMWLDEKSYDEIAAVTGISRTCVAQRLHRIRAKLSKLADQ